MNSVVRAWVDEEMADGFMRRLARPTCYCRSMLLSLEGLICSRLQARMLRVSRHSKETWEGKILYWLNRL